MECIFCRIVAGEIPGEIVAETPDVLAFLDVMPLADAHVLVIPKAHARLVEELPDATAGALMQMAGRVSSLSARSLLRLARRWGSTTAPKRGRPYPMYTFMWSHGLPAMAPVACIRHFPGFATDPAPLPDIAEKLRQHLGSGSAAG